MEFTLTRRLAAEAVGTLLLVAVVVGSGIMAETLSGGNVAIALLGNTLATGAILVVLITIFGGVSGAHFNPAVTLVFALRREIAVGAALAYVGVQIVGGVAGTFLRISCLIRRSCRPPPMRVPAWGNGCLRWRRLSRLSLQFLGQSNGRPQPCLMRLGL